jgi:hypothetical protein
VGLSRFGARDLTLVRCLGALNQADGVQRVRGAGMAKASAAASTTLGMFSPDADAVISHNHAYTGDDKED